MERSAIQGAGVFPDSASLHLGYGALNLIVHHDGDTGFVIASAAKQSLSFLLNSCEIASLLRSSQ
jgi:hypothetical protein